MCGGQEGGEPAYVLTRLFRNGIQGGILPVAAGMALLFKSLKVRGMLR